MQSRLLCRCRCWGSEHKGHCGICTRLALGLITYDTHAAAVENEHLRHLSQCTRPPLAQCTEQELEDKQNFKQELIMQLCK